MNEGGTDYAAVEKVGERELRYERVFDAPRERVFAAHTTAELIERWWGPRSGKTRVEELDARSGGRWRFVIVDEDGSETEFRGVYREVSAPERIVQTFEWAGMPGYVSVDTGVFEDLGDGRTRLSGTTVFHHQAEREGMVESGMERGMNEGFDKLAELLAQG